MINVFGAHDVVHKFDLILQNLHMMSVALSSQYTVIWEEDKLTFETNQQKQIYGVLY